MRRTRLRLRNRAVSPVVATALLLGIVVILGAIASVFLTTVTDPPTQPPDPDIEYDYEQDCLGDDQLRVIYEGGRSLDAARTYAVLNGTRNSMAQLTGSDTFAGGDVVTLNATTGGGYDSDMWGETLRIVWVHPESGDSFVISEYEVPMGCPGT